MYFQYGSRETEYLKSRDKALGEVIDRIGPVFRETDPDLFSSVVHHIVGQQISTKAQATIWRRFQDGFEKIDADHILLRPHTFLTRRGRTVFYGSRECHQPYYDTAARLVGGVRMEWLSYVDHKMLFSRTQLDALKERLEARSRKSWDRAILDSLPGDETSGFSEYELYGLTFPARKKVVRPWRNKTLHYDELADYDTLRRRWGRRYRAVTFPEWINR